MRPAIKIALQPAVTKGVNFSGTRFISKRLASCRELVITLDITAAERDSANETYDFYITMGDGVSEWDIAHFTQVATTGAKRFTRRVLAELLPQNVTSATPGVAAVDPSELATVSGGTNAIKSLTAGLTRHGPFGDRIGHELVVAGTIATGITYSIQITAIR